ncbi:hypothetical protein PF005_g23321 [Phytophthora fragariae]|uniref:Uncharacterized protein n=1 Tax=Phytophthora fragariae TaxID=53985 RepID=A0A6A3X438_9STRA|nr:hypothetical protein PF003_g33312 [Phytophthora fragariae]KAE9079628.1 hypothetical protein PF010_g22687 [Phytophthora fragariae]KAE9107675.1 hypothetical protein PF007_g12949 [Phytophthora fragariae]KAE9146011.1 hypothetical protein PF006_g9180 [Phytophthora fragariae]KAE9180327.1 hypothetical protein PF005_g23321 [Phytophthora fragariae]
MTIGQPVASCKKQLSKRKKNFPKARQDAESLGPSNVKSTLVCVGASNPPPSPPCARQVGSNEQVKTPSAAATAAATHAPKAAATIAAAPTRGVASAGNKPTANKNYSGGNNANASNKSASMNATAKGIKPHADMNANSTTLFALNDLTAGIVQRAGQIRKTCFERPQKFYKLFVAKGEQVVQWMRGTVNSKALAYIREIQETRQTLLVLLIVSTALTKYDENELARRDSLGEMDSVIGARFDTTPSSMCRRWWV